MTIKDYTVMRYMDEVGGSSIIYLPGNTVLTPFDIYKGLVRAFDNGNTSEKIY